jgi:hypothetical protein
VAKVVSGGPHVGVSARVAAFAALFPIKELVFPPVLHRSTNRMKEVFWAETVRSLFDAATRAHKRELETKRR